MKKTKKHLGWLSILATSVLAPSHLHAYSADEVNTIVDVSFNWTQERTSNYGGVNQVKANMNQSLGITNTAHDNSNTGVYFNYIIIGGALSYNANSNDNSSVADLRAGIIPGTVSRRNQTGSDMMALNCQMAAAGLAYRGDPRQYAVKFLTGPASAHEIGHTFGLGHGGIGASTSDGSGDTPYASGWATTSNGPRQGTIMTGAQIMWYSTPEKTFNGQTTGIPNVKDSTRRIRETRRESSRQRNIRPEGGRSGGWWTIQNAFSNLYVSLQSNNSNNGTRLVQRSRQNNSWEQWRFDSANAGGGWITSRNRQTNKAIDMTGNSNNGRHLHQWSYNINNQNQHFKFDHDDSGLVRLRFRRGGKVLHNHGRSTNSGNRLTQWNWQGSSHLQWYMTRSN